MKVRKLLVVALVGGLIGSMGVAEAAKKKPAKTVQKDVTFYVNQIETADGDVCSEGLMYLSLKEQENPVDAPHCGNVLYGAPTELLLNAGQESALAEIGLDLAGTVYPAMDGVPFVLDATKDLTGLMRVSNYCCVGDGIFAGAGAAVMEVFVTGTSGGEEKQIGTVKVEHQVIPGQDYHEIEFKISPDKALDKASFTSLELKVRHRGAAAGGFHYESNSTLVVPQLAKK